MFWDYIIARRPLCEHGKKEGKESCWTHHQNRIDFQREIDFLGHVCQWHTAQDPPTLQCLFAENVAETFKETKVEGIIITAFFLLKRKIQRWFLLLRWNLKGQYISICKLDLFAWQKCHIYMFKPGEIVMFHLKIWVSRHTLIPQICI